MAGRFVNDEVGILPGERFGHCLNLGTVCNMLQWLRKTKNNFMSYDRRPGRNTNPRPIFRYVTTAYGGESLYVHGARCVQTNVTA